MIKWDNETVAQSAQSTMRAVDPMIAELNYEAGAT